MNYLIVSGSPRDDSQALRISRWFERQFAEPDGVRIIDLATVYVPEDTSGLKRASGVEVEQFAGVKQSLEWCDGIIIVSPEWHGMAPGKLISFLQAAAEGGPLAHKPGLIVAESSGMGGAYTVSMLRGYTGKNTRVLWLPEHLIVRDNERMFLKDPSDENDIYIQRRAQYCINLQREYTEALAPIRTSLTRDRTVFRNGM